MTDDRSPFRRFPWVQLVFCVACLTMTAWTWMRFSYCCQMGRGDPSAAFMEVAFGGGRVWSSRLVAATGRVVRRKYYGSMDRKYWDSSYWVEPPFWHATVELGEPGDEEGRIGVIVPDEITVGSIETFSGRLEDVYPGTGVLWIVTTASRFHPASIAGLVMGAMGVFVFGLYLRRWVKERGASR